MTVSNVMHGYAPVNGGKIYYEVAGEGEAILFIHGLFNDSRLWDNQFKSFSEEYKVIRFDARGFGNTEIDAQPFANYDDIKGLLEYLQVEKAHVVGLSMGGLLALELAIVYPELVSSLVLCSFKLMGNDETAELQEDKKAVWQALLAGEIDRCVDLNEDKWFYGSAQVGQLANDNLSLYRDMLHFNLSKPMIERKPIFIQNITDRIAEVQAKTLILYGEYDYPDYSTGADLLNRGIKHSQKQSFSKSAHMINLTEPEQFNKTLYDFLKLIKE